MVHCLNVFYVLRAPRSTPAHRVPEFLDVNRGVRRRFWISGGYERVVGAPPNHPLFRPAGSAGGGLEKLGNLATGTKAGQEPAAGG